MYSDKKFYIAKCWATIYTYIRRILPTPSVEPFHKILSKLLCIGEITQTHRLPAISIKNNPTPFL